MLKSLKTLLLTVSSSRLVGYWLRYQILTFLGMQASDFVHISHNCYFSSTDLTNLNIGRRCFINTGCYFDLTDKIHLEDNVCVAPQVTFITANHIVGTSVRRAGRSLSSGIQVNEGVWIRARATILPSTVIQKGAVIGAGETVSGVIEADTIYKVAGSFLLTSTKN